MPNLYLQCLCGELIAKSRWRLGKRDCVNCALARSVEHSLQMKRKCGAAWDHYKEAMGRILAEESSATDRVDHGSEGIGSVDH